MFIIIFQLAFIKKNISFTFLLILYISFIFLLIFRYFVSIALQFQLFQSLCEISGHTGELHTCDIYRSREAGRLLSYVKFMKVL